MSTSTSAGAGRPAPDDLLVRIADYVCDFEGDSPAARRIARYCLLDSLGCAILALDYPECTKLLGPIVPGATLEDGARVPGTDYVLDPVKAAFDTGALIRWLDYNDTWLAAEWGHPSDNLGAILAVADYLGRGGRLPGRAEPTIGDVLTAMIKAHEIQGVLALENAFNRVGLDHVLLVRVASTAVVTRMLGGTRAQIVNATSHAFVDGGALRTYRHAPNTGSRKSWAAGDAAARAVFLALVARRGEMGCPSVLTAERWGFEDRLFRGDSIRLARPLGSYVMENVLFKISFPAEFHAQTAAEAALELHDAVAARLDEIETIRIETQEPGMRIINKTGPLANPADRDHCLQYIVAVALLHGRLTAEDYEDRVAADPRIDALRDRMQVEENETFSRDYLDPDKRAIGNALQVFFRDGSSTSRVEIHYPLGHARRRDEGIPALMAKLRRNLAGRLPAARIRAIEAVAEAESEPMKINDFMNLWIDSEASY